MLITKITYALLALLFVTECEAMPIYHKVKWVYDGDTLRLEDGRKIRLIGINAPEIAHHKKRGQPYAREATEKLRALLKGADNKVRLEQGQQTKDRYQRHLAHVFLADGTNISQWMLQYGWATLMVFPPNTQYINAYRNSERSAQQKKLHIWRQKQYQIQSPRTLKRRYRGYVRLKSTIKSIKITKNNVTLQLEKKIFIRLHKRFMPYFTAYNPEKLHQREVIISGLLQKIHGKYRIILRHPVQLALGRKRY